jgi:hypothetical protein
MGKISTLGVLRLRAIKPAASDKSVRRFAQDDVLMEFDEKPPKEVTPMRLMSWVTFNSFGPAPSTSSGQAAGLEGFFPTWRFWNGISKVTSSQARNKADYNGILSTFWM